MAGADHIQTEAVGVVLRRIAGEIVAFAEITDRMQGLTEALARHGGAEHHKTIQEIDWLHQHLLEIAEVLELASGKSEETWQIDLSVLTQDVRLGRLRHSLRQCTKHHAAAEDDDDTEDVEFF